MKIRFTISESDWYSYYHMLAERSGLFGWKRFLTVWAMPIFIMVSFGFFAWKERSQSLFFMGLPAGGIMAAVAMREWDRKVEDNLNRLVHAAKRRFTNAVELELIEDGKLLVRCEGARLEWDRIESLALTTNFLFIVATLYGFPVALFSLGQDGRQFADRLFLLWNQRETSGRLLMLEPTHEEGWTWNNLETTNAIREGKGPQSSSTANTRIRPSE